MTDILLPDLRSVQLQRKRRLMVGLLALLLVIAFVGSAWPGPSWPRRVIEDGGLLLILVAIVGRAWCSLYIGGRKKAELVQQGPYALCRNPLYLFSFIGVFGAGAQTGSLGIASLFLIMTVAIFLPVVRQEEAYLSQAFTEAFEDYARRTPRFIPRPGLWRVDEELTTRPAFFLRTLLDGLPFLLAWPLFDALGRLHDTIAEPVLRLL